MKKKKFLKNCLNFCLVSIIPFQKYPNFLRICSLFGKNLPNFASPDLKLHNQYCHDSGLGHLRALAHGCGQVSTADPSSQSVGQPATLQLISNFHKRKHRDNKKYISFKKIVLLGTILVNHA